jgi:hypothetical protein
MRRSGLKYKTSDGADQALVRNRMPVTNPIEPIKWRASPTTAEWQPVLRIYRAAKRTRLAMPAAMQ